jgi:hypothetical protein
LVPSSGFSVKQDISIEWILGGKLFGSNVFVINDSPGPKSARIQDFDPDFSIKVYPTYTKDFVTVEIRSGTNNQFFLDLYNNIGKKVIEGIVMKQPSMKVKMTHLNTGIYFLKITTPLPEQGIHVEKIIKL